MKSKLILYAIVFAIAVILISTYVQHPAPSEIVTIGAILPLSGNTAFIGEDLKRGMDLAAMSTQMSIVYGDTAGDTLSMVSAYRQLMTQNKPTAVLAAGTGVEAIIPLAEHDKIPLLITDSSASHLPKLGEYVFRYFTNADTDAPVIGEHSAHTLGLKKIAVLYTNDQFGMDYLNIFADTLRTYGASVVASDSFGYDQFDFRTQIAKLQSAHPDAIYLIGLEYQLIPLIKQIRRAGMAQQLLALGTIATADAINKLGADAEGIYVTAFCTDGSPAAYVDMFKQKYGTYPGFFSEIGYDMIRMLDIATKNTSAPDDIRNNLLHIHDLQTNTGRISSDSSGEMIIPMCIKQIRNGKIFNTATGNYSAY